MTWKRRSVFIKLYHAILWLLVNRVRIKGFQFHGVESLVLVSSCRHRRPETVVCRIDGAISKRWGLYASSILYSLPSPSQQAEGSDTSTPSSFAPSQPSQSRTNSQVEPPHSSTSTASKGLAALGTPLASSSSSSPAFYDQAILNVRAGSGGSGATFFELLNSNGGGSSSKRKQQGAPNGGSGGRGGHVMLQVDADLNTLAGLAVRQGKNPAGSVVLRAENGMDGQGRKRSGAPGRDVIVRVPPGTIVEELIMSGDADLDGGDEKWVELGRLALAKQTRSSSFDTDDFSGDDSNDDAPSSLIIARGGRGGDGNSVYANAAASRRRGASKSTVHREGATAGERKIVRLTLQFLADVAIVGMPNAGKSTFLAAVTRAKPKIANYAFTTIVPNLGVWINDEEDVRAEAVADTDPIQKLVLCDVPGLVQGASKGVGLGHEFLRHVERCSVLVHLVDGTSPSAVEDYQMINRELAQYAGGMLASKPQVVIVNKLDLLEKAATGNEESSSSSIPARDGQSKLQEALLLAMPHSRLLWMSAKEKQGVENVMRKVATFVQKVNQAVALAAVPAEG